MACRMLLRHAPGMLMPWWLCSSVVGQTGEVKYQVTVRPTGQPTPATVVCAAAARDEQRDALLVFGGADPERKNAPPLLRKMDLGTFTWSIVETKGAAPSAAVLPAMVYDPKRDAVFLWGGWASGAEKPSGELWTLPLGETSPRTWKRLADGPPARNGCVMVLDGLRDRLLLFAGDGGPHPKYGYTPLNDLWAFDLPGGTWTQLASAADAPAPRWNLAAAVDNTRGRMFVFGGAGYVKDKPVRDSFVFELDMAKLTWTKHAGKGKQPPPMEGATLTYDPGKDLLVVVGGLSIADAGEAGSTSVWLYDLKNDRWVEKAGVFDTTRRSHVAMYDPRRNEHIVVGGETAQERGNFYVRGKTLLDVLKLSITSE